MKNNILVIGMAGVGKTFNSKILAERLGYNYVWSDDLMTQGASGMDKKYLCQIQILLHLKIKLSLGLWVKKKVIRKDSPY